MGPEGHFEILSVICGVLKFEEDLSLIKPWLRF